MFLVLGFRILNGKKWIFVWVLGICRGGGGLFYCGWGWGEALSKLTTFFCGAGVGGGSVKSLGIWGGGGVGIVRNRVSTYC